MTIEELAKKEIELYYKVIEIYKNNLKVGLDNIYNLYKDIHWHYSVLAKYDDEALKRGLFIQWYSLTEPGYATGIGLLDEIAEIKIIDIIESKIQKNDIDSELNWMLNYYANWDFVFEKFESFPALTEFISNRMDTTFKFNKVEMSQRGQMGEYFNSLEFITPKYD